MSNPLTVPRIDTPPPPCPIPGYLTTAEISFRASIEQESLARIIRNGKLKALKLGNMWIIKEGDWEEYEKNKKPSGAPRGPRKRRPKK